MTATAHRRRPSVYRLGVLATVLVLTAATVALFIWQPAWRDLPGGGGLAWASEDPATDAAVAATGGDPDLGRTALASYGCITCHSIPGVPGANAYVGPPLTAWVDRVYVAGLLTNTPEHLIYWIQDPQSVVPGNAMPNLGVTDSDARNIAAYLYTLHD